MDYDKFAEEFLGCKLTWYQKAMLKIVDKMPVKHTRYFGKHDIYAQMELMYKVLGLDKEE